jgi:hypothetical protein
MRYQIYKLCNFLVSLIPAPILRRLLRALQVHPDIATRVGYQVYQQLYCNPFPIPGEVDLEKLKLKRSLPGINLRIPQALKLTRELSYFSAEVEKFLKHRSGNLIAWDMTYPPCDSATLYSMVRHLKPKRYIEVGCGYSSRACIAALKENAADGHPCHSTFIEPYPPPHLTEIKLPGELIAKKIEQVPLERFQQLEAGDILFIDTSHVIKVQNDCEFELLHVLPSLKPGVIVHIHDIFTPYDYPAEWLVGDGPNHGGNNEQYAFECLLSGGETWEVILPVHHLWRDHRAELGALLKSEERPAAFWIKKVR